MTKIARSGPKSGSTPKCHGSATLGPAVIMLHDLEAEYACNRPEARCEPGVNGLLWKPDPDTIILDPLPHLVSLWVSGNHTLQCTVWYLILKPSRPGPDQGRGVSLVWMVAPSRTSTTDTARFWLCSTNWKYALYYFSLQFCWLLKGQCHDIFCFRFFHESSTPSPWK